MKAKGIAVAPKTLVRNLQRRIKIDTLALKKFANKAYVCVLKISKNGPTELTRLRDVLILLVSDDRMRALHREFLSKNAPTDVLTFQHGEIVISVDTARENARRFESSLDKELRLYLVHGLLHLHGFDDRRKADAKQMERAQKQILRLV